MLEKSKNNSNKPMDQSYIYIYIWSIVWDEKYDL